MCVLTLLGTRPETIKLSRVIHELERHVRHVLVHTGQNFDYELNEIFFRQLEIKKPDYFLEAAGGSAAATIGNIIQKLDLVLEKEKPDAFLVLGDTNSSLGAIAVKRRKIPIFHMEAGNRCFDQRVPEEINRRLMDHLSDINLTYTEQAREYLRAENVPPETIFKTGSPMKEVLEHYRPQIDRSDALQRLGLERKKYLLVSTHREENIESEENFRDLLDALSAIQAKYRMPVIVSTHPRTRKRLDALKQPPQDPEIRFLKPFGFFDYVHLQRNAYCVISDSGTITEESSILDFPAVMIRQAHERPEGFDEGTLVMTGLKAERILDAIQVVTTQAEERSGSSRRAMRIVGDYDTDNVSAKVLRIILSYTDYVNRTVWKKDKHG